MNPAFTVHGIEDVSISAHTIKVHDMPVYVISIDAEDTDHHSTDISIFTRELSVVHSFLPGWSPPDEPETSDS